MRRAASVARQLPVHTAPYATGAKRTGGQTPRAKATKSAQACPALSPNCSRLNPACSRSAWTSRTVCAELDLREERVGAARSGRPGGTVSAGRAVGAEEGA
ncbi:hypothetical protein GCM10010400_35530 [Streptomyces aculeolatus]